MVAKHPLSFVLSGVTVVVGLFAAWAVLAGGDTTQGLPPEAPPPGVTFSPTPSLLADVPDIGDAIRALRSRAADSVRWRRAECQNTGLRGVSGCQLYGVPPGTILEFWNPEEGVIEYELQRNDAEAMLSYLLDGRHPQLDLIARRDDGAFLVVVGVDPRPDVSFPGAVPTNSGDITAIEFLIDGPTGDIFAASSKPRQRPPLETVRYQEHRGRAYKILGKSQAFAEREKAFADELEAHTHDPVNITPTATR